MIAHCRIRAEGRHSHVSTAQMLRTKFAPYKRYIQTHFQSGPDRGVAGGQSLVYKFIAHQLISVQCVYIYCTYVRMYRCTHFTAYSLQAVQSTMCTRCTQSTVCTQCTRVQAGVPTSIRFPLPSLFGAPRNRPKRPRMVLGDGSLESPCSWLSNGPSPKIIRVR